MADDDLAEMKRSVAEMIGRVNFRLGFGCAHLYAGQDRDQSLRLIEAAIDSGINYFDTARLYGHGDAEGLVGSIRPRIRQRIYLATKAGILPTHNPWHRRLRSKVRTLARRLPPLTRYVAAPKPAEPRFGVFGVRELRRSVERSLRALRTDYVDLLLLHECETKHATDPDIMSLLAALKAEGKIRAWGLATSFETTLSVAKAGAHVPFLQVADGAFGDDAARLRGLTDAALSIHSVLGPRFRELLQALRADQELRAQAKELDVDPDDAVGLAQRLIARALYENPEGIVLFSAGNAGHIGSNVAAAALGAKQAAAAGDLVRAWMRSRSAPEAISQP